MPPGTGGIQKLNFFVKIAPQRQTLGQSVGLAADKTLSLPACFGNFDRCIFDGITKSATLSAPNANNSALHKQRLEGEGNSEMNWVEEFVLLFMRAIFFEHNKIYAL